MDFEYKYTPEQQAFRQEVRSWLNEHVPEAMKSQVDRLDLSDEHYRFWRDMHMRLAEKGWLYPGLAAGCPSPEITADASIVL